MAWIQMASVFRARAVISFATRRQSYAWFAAPGGEYKLLRKTRGRRSGTTARAEVIQTAESGGREQFLFRGRTIDCESNRDGPRLAGR